MAGWRPREATPDTAPTNTRCDLMAVVGFQEEAQLLLQQGVRVVISAANPALLERRLEAAPVPDAVLSFGVAGGLRPDLLPGSLILADAILSPEGRWACDAAWHQRLAARLAEGQQGPLWASPQVIGSTAEKARLYAASQALAVEMESAIAARYAARHGLPFLALRAVADSAADVLPALAQNALQPDGRPAIGRVLGGLARNPLQLPALMRLARSNKAAIGSLRAALQAVGKDLTPR